MAADTGENDNILLRAVSEGQKGLYVPRIQEAEYILFWSEENEEVNIYKLCW
ncbi:MAG: hypothetical protein ACLU6Y_09380 [Ruminococcus sp.]